MNWVGTDPISADFGQSVHHPTTGMAIKVASEPQDLEWPPKLLPSGESGVTTSDNFLQMASGMVYG